MRLIDADAIVFTHAIARSIDDGHNWNELCVTKDEIDDMPSAEPERTAKVVEDEWTEHKMLSRDYGKIYYQHDCCCDLYESPYQFCPYCGKKMKRKNHE